MNPSKKVTVLQHLDIETPGLLGDLLLDAGFELKTVLSFQNQPVPENLEDSAGLVVMGGPMGVYEEERYPYLKEEMRLIESALKARKPVIGICLGSQLLAAALGARVFPGKQKEIGWIPVRLSEAGQKDPLWKDAPVEFTPLQWHGDIFDLPKDAVNLASSDLTACQAFRAGSAAGFLFHLEVTQSMVRQWVMRFQDELKTVGSDGSEILLSVSENVRNAQALGRQVFGRWIAGLEPARSLQSEAGASKN